MQNDELEKTGTKFTKDEKGNSSAELEHVLNGNGKSTGHATDFERAFGIPSTEISLP